MRPLVFIAFAVLALGGCRDKGQSEASRNAGAGLTADRIVANDVTAIDAVTADAANMAADINYADALSEISNNSATENSTGAGQPKSRRTGASPPSSRTTSSDRQATSETATNAE